MAFDHELRQDRDERITEDVLDPAVLDEYRQAKAVILQSLVTLSTNLSMIRQMDSFPVEFYQGPRSLLHYLTAMLYQYTIVIAHRLWGDSDGFTLRNFRNLVMRSVVDPAVRARIGERLTTIRGAEEELDEISGRIRDLRHKRYAHADRKLTFEPGARVRPVSLDELERLGGTLTSIYSAILWNEAQHFVFIELAMPDADYFGGGLGYVLRLIALRSKWVTVFDEYGPEAWDRMCRDGISTEQLAEINRLRAMDRLPPIPGARGAGPE